MIDRLNEFEFTSITCEHWKYLWGVQVKHKKTGKYRLLERKYPLTKNNDAAYAECRAATRELLDDIYGPNNW